MHSSSDFERILVQDDRIGCVTSQIKYTVLKGGHHVASQVLNTNSKSTSAHVFNIAAPSLETIISREVLWACALTLQITVGSRAGFPRMFAVSYGVADALAPFPLHQLASTMTAAINNNSVTMKVQEVLPALLSMHGLEELAECDSTTPTMLG